MLCATRVAAAPDPENASVVVRLSRLYVDVQAGTQPNQRFSIYNDGQPANLISSPELTVTRSAEGILSVQTATLPVELSAATLPDCKVLVPSRGGASIQVDFDLGLASIQSRPDHPPATVQFTDGASARVPASATLYYEQFARNTYGASAKGEISAKDAEGKEWVLSESSPPLTGGPLVRVTGADGQVRLKRSSPVLTATVRGKVGYSLQVQVDNQTFDLRGTEPQLLRLKNGSILQVGQESGRGALAWQVVKGSFLLELEGIPNWKALGWSGQKARFSWDPVAQAVDVENLSADGVMMIGMPNRIYAAVSSKSTVQFVRLGDQTYAASAASGTVSLHNQTSGQRFELGRGQLMVNRGVVEGSPAPVVPTVSVGWVGPDKVAVTAADRRFTVEAGTTQILPCGDGGQLRVEFTSDRRLVLQALAGHYAITPAALPGVVLSLTEGAEFQFLADPSRGTIAGKAGHGNAGAIQLTTKSGTTVSIQSGQDVSLMLPAAGIFGFGQGAVYTEQLEAAGPDSNLSSTTVSAPIRSSFERNPGAIFVPRITQPPVSVIDHDSD